MNSINLQDAPCGIFLLDHDLMVLDANNTLGELLGRTCKDLIGRSLDDFLAPSFRLLFHIQALTPLHVNGRVDEVFLNLSGADGQEIPVLLNAVRLQDGDLTVIQCAVIRVNKRKRLEDDLFNIKKAVGQVPGVVYQYLRKSDGSASIPYASEGIRTIYGLRPLQIMHSAKLLHERTHPDDLHGFLQSIEASAHTLTMWHLEYRINLPDKGIRWLEGRALPEARMNGDVLWHGYIHDITERRALQSALASEHERTLVTLRSIGDAVITTNAHAEVERLNPAAELLTGWSQAEAQGQDIEKVLQLVDENAPVQIESAVRRCLAERVVIGLQRDSVLTAIQGNTYAVEGSAAPILDSAGDISGVVMVFRNVTEQRRRRRAVEHRAKHDYLTGLPNRAEFDRVLKQLFETAKASGAVHALCCIDLDRFKQVNDTAGHAAGDQLLRRVADVLQACVRTKDTVVRLGGDEFALLLESCDLEAAHRVATIVCSKIQALQFEYRGEVFSIGASIGLALIDSHWSQPHDVQLAADQACFAAKAAGRNCVRVASTPDDPAPSK